jgi:predicted flap endonuclease-1-like 5' DNA nuclease
MNYTRPIISLPEQNKIFSMRAFLFMLLAAVAAIMLWAIRSESYQNGLVFALATLASGLCGYLLADYFFNIEKKTLKEDIASAGKDIQALKDEKDLLQTQFNLATPHAQVEQLEQQLSFADEQRHKLDGLTRAQYAEIAALKTQLDMQKKNYQKLYEEAAIATETHNAEITNLEDTLASKREKIKYLTDEGNYLRNKIKGFETASEEDTIQRVVSEVNALPAPNLPKMVVKMPQNGNGSERGILQMIDPRSVKSKSDTVEAEVVVEMTAIDPQPIMELKPIDLKTFLEKKTADLPVVEETVSIVENSTVEPPVSLDAPPSVSERKLSLAEIIAEVQAAELQDSIEAKVSEVEALAVETTSIIEEALPIVVEKTIETAPIVVENTGEVILVENKVEAAPVIVEKLVEPTSILVENKVEVAPVIVEKLVEPTPIIVENKVEPEPVVPSNSIATLINDEHPVHEMPVFSFSKKFDPPKATNTPIVSLSKSIAIPKTPTVEMPTIANSISDVEEGNLAVASKSIPTAAVAIPTTFVEDIPTDASNLQAIQGIDAETERVLKSAGIDTWQEVSEATPQRLNDILKEGKIRGVDVTHWSIQAVLLADGHFNRLKTFLENLKK